MEEKSASIGVTRPENVICKDCGVNITKKQCFCDKLDYYNKHIQSVLKIQKWIKYNILSIYTLLKSNEIQKKFEYEVKGFHMIHKQPIKESIWERINENVIRAHCNVTDIACGNHKSGKDMKINNWNISNKSCKIEKNNRINISSYRLSTVCNNKNIGCKKDIIEEIERRDSTFDYYSLL